MVVIAWPRSGRFFVGLDRSPHVADRSGGRLHHRIAESTQVLAGDSQFPELPHFPVYNQAHPEPLLRGVQKSASAIQESKSKNVTIEKVEARAQEQWQPAPEDAKPHHAPVGISPASRETSASSVITAT